MTGKGESFVVLLTAAAALAGCTLPFARPAGDARYEGDCIFCFLDGSDPRMPVQNLSGGYRPSDRDTREQVVIDRGFSVPAGAETDLRNQIVWIRPSVRGDIEIRGTLRIEDSLLLWDQTQHQETRFRVEAGGSLVIRNSYAFSANSYWVNWDFTDGSTVDLDHYVGSPWTSLRGSVRYSSTGHSTVNLTVLRETADSDIEISDAHHVWLEIIPPAGTFSFALPQKRAWADWDLNDVWPGTVVSFRHSYIYERDISLTDNVKVTVRDTPDGFGLGWTVSNGSDERIQCELRDLCNPDDNNGVYYEEKSWSLPCDGTALTLVRSRLLRAWPNIFGNVRLAVHHSNLVDPRNYAGPGVMEIYDCTIDHLAAYAGGQIYVENSRLADDVEVKDPGSAVYAYNLQSRNWFHKFQVLEVDGGVFRTLQAPGAPWNAAP